MNIKDIIDAERRRLRTHARKGTQHHSWGEAALNRIEAAVEQHIAELEKPVDDEEVRRLAERFWTTSLVRSQFEKIVDELCAILRRERSRADKAEQRIAELEEQRDLAIAHDSQPYPTAWAYEQVCKTLEAAKQRIKELEKQNIDLLEEVVDALQDVVFYVPRPTTTSAHADRVLPEYERQLKKARGDA